MTKGRAIQNFLKFINAAGSDCDGNSNANVATSTLASTAANTQQKPKTNKINYKRTQTQSQSHTSVAEDVETKRSKEHEQKPTMRRAIPEVLVLWNNNKNICNSSSSDSGRKGNGAWN